MAHMATAINTVAMLAVLLAVGYLLAWKVKLTTEQYKLVAEIVILAAIPSMLFMNVLDNITLDVLRDGIMYISVAFAAQVLLFVLSAALARLVRVPQSRRGMFSVLCTLSNTILVGTPICVGFFGPTAIPYLMFFYIANTILFWTYGNYLMKRDAGCENNRFSMGLMLKNLVTAPALIGFFAGLIVVLTKIQLPAFLLSAVRGVGTMSTPLSMVYIGMMLYRAGFKTKADLPLVALLAMRFVVSPILVIIPLKALSVPLLGVSVMALQAAMPTMTQSSVVAGRVGADAEYAAKITAITTLLCLITSPVIAAVMQMLY